MRTILVLFLLTGLLSARAEQPMASDFKIEFGKVSRASRFESDTMSIWGGSLVKREDGLYHMFYSRWPKAPGWNWVTPSEIAHAVSESPFGPFTFKEVTLPIRGAKYWDGLCTHNPTIHKFEGLPLLYGEHRRRKDRGSSR